MSKLQEQEIRQIIEHYQKIEMLCSSAIGHGMSAYGRRDKEIDVALRSAQGHATDGRLQAATALGLVSV